MSRQQQGQTFNQTKGESTGAFGNAENALSLEGADIGNYQQQLGQYAAENPYKAGGEFQADQNRILANTADASSAREAATLQGLARRTGQNPAAANATAEAINQTNERSLAGQEAGADAERLGSEAGYNKGVVAGYGAVPGMEEGVARGYSGLYGTALGTQEKAAETPSFLETLESQTAQAGDSFLGGLGQGIGKGGG